MRPSTRITLFVLSLALLVATATPAVAHEADEVGEGHHATASATPAATEALARDLLRADPAVAARSVNARLIAQWHDGHGHNQWSGGRGHWGHSWSTYKVQARQLRTYLLSQSDALRRFALIMHWAKVADCESSGNWAINTGNGYYGGLQFSMGTWRAYGGEGNPQDQPAWYQAQIADNVRTQSGLQHWPVCGVYYR